MLKLERHFTKADVDVFDMFEWQYVDVHIENASNGQIIFDAKHLEFPAHYNRNACDIIAKMYFVKKGVPETDHEISMRQVVSRMADFWARALIDEEVLKKEDYNIFFDEVRYIMLKQMWAPNTPQWFNTGLFHSYGFDKEGNGSFYYDEKLKKVVEAKYAYERTPASACFITHVDDSLFGDQSLTEHLTTASRLFSYGSGIGTNWSNIRGAGEALTPGGVSSGVMSFLKVFDSNAGAIKSGGTHRRSSCMTILDLDHPDIFDFINWKSKEEDKVRALGKMGYSLAMNGPAYETVSGQNCNNSVSIPDSFMKLLHVPGAKWKLKGRVDSSKDREISVKDLWNAICKAAWECGDPGVHFNDTMNEWNTCINSGRIRASNPCFPYDTRILTEDGYKPIGSLCDRKFNLINSQGKIVEGKVWSSGEKETIKLIFGDGSTLRCTPDHPIMLRDGTTVLAKDTLGKRVKTFHNPADILIDRNAYEAGLKVNINSIHSMSIIEKLCDSTSGFYNEESDRKIRSLIKGIFDNHGKLVEDGLQLDSLNKSVELIQKYLAAHDINGYITSILDSGSIAYRLKITDLNSLMKFHGTIGFHDGIRLTDMLSSIPGKKVTKIEESIIEEVYDFFEPEDHFGVVEGIVVHNCSEFLFLDNSACNLSSINLVPFYKDGKFDLKSYRYVAKLAILVMESSAHWGCFPTMQIAENTYKFRPLGLGYTNLGALIMKLGLAYDSDEARGVAAFLMNVLTVEAYKTSALIAKEIGPFEKFEENKFPMLKVLEKHSIELNKICKDNAIVKNNHSEIKKLWKEVIDFGKEYGYRNAQTSLCAPCGTISFAMNCDSTGLEPFFSNIVYKKVADGSFMSMTNNVIEDGLKALKYPENEIEEIMKYIEDNHGKIEGAPYLKERDLPVFDTAGKNGDGIRCITPIGHLKMVAALQNNMSGSSSKTINCSNEVTIADISEIYEEAWKLGCKCVALYRDGCKAAQPLTTSIEDPNAAKPLEQYTYQELLEYAKNKSIEVKVEAQRERLPFEPKCIKNEIQMDDQTFHIIRSFYDDGRLGEIFVTVGKNGSTVKGLQEVLCMIISKALQYGVPADVLAKTMRHHEFSPNGFVYNHPFIKSASSIPDLMSKFLDISTGNYQYCQVKPNVEENVENKIEDKNIEGLKFEPVYGERCSECGSTKLVKAGVCKYCQSCGNSTGCS